MSAGRGEAVSRSPGTPSATTAGSAAIAPASAACGCSSRGCRCPCPPEGIRLGSHPSSGGNDEWQPCPDPSGCAFTHIYLLLDNVAVLPLGPGPREMHNYRFRPDRKPVEVISPAVPAGDDRSDQHAVLFGEDHGLRIAAEQHGHRLGSIRPPTVVLGRLFHNATRSPTSGCCSPARVDVLTMGSCKAMLAMSIAISPGCLRNEGRF